MRSTTGTATRRATGCCGRLPTAIYRIGGDEFVVFPLDAEQRRCEARMRKVAVAVRAEGYAISYGIACRRDETGLDALVRAADERMLDYKRAYYAEHDRRKPR